MSPIKPKPIKTGDVAYIISPSAGLFPFVKNRVRRAEENLERLGLIVKYASNAGKNSGYVSSSIEDRIHDIHQAFLDKDCSLVMAAIGGDHSNQLINRLDYNLIRNNPKTFVGYSDNTVLHLALLSQSNLQTYYGPCFLNQFGEFPHVLDYTLTDFKKVIGRKDYVRRIKASDSYTDEILDWFKDEDSKRPRELWHNSGFVWWKAGAASGWALPAAIPSINHVIGTKYMPSTEGAILLIDIPEGSSMHEGLSVANVDAWLTDLENADIFNKIKGLIIGRPYKYTPQQIGELRDVVGRVGRSYSFPILFNADFGHTDPMITIPYGARMRIDSTTNSFEFV